MIEDAVDEEAPTPKMRSMNRLWNLFDEYANEVRASRLSESSKTDYILFSEFFVRWIEGYFTPGSNVK